VRRSSLESASCCTSGPVTVTISCGSFNTTGSGMPADTGVRHNTS
jgi:hypothetical protein